MLTYPYGALNGCRNTSVTCPVRLKLGGEGRQ